MPEAILESQVCSSCGADVRPDTQFCYNCGKSVLPHEEPTKAETLVLDDESKASLADLEHALAAEFPPTPDSKKKIEEAAAERRRARKVMRKMPDAHWEHVSETSGRLYVLLVTLIFFIAAAIVFITVFMK